MRKIPVYVSILDEPGTFALSFAIVFFVPILPIISG
jgi:hypothetical protein